ncbi:hypothetical protein [Bacillus sp. SG-1]|uniref:hypothetical protein n=1 Tax=Bacillus sp. SG-1 TaxID=161544 RepID=UPI0005C51E8B|nr:hypothetical protein [Bacillus sp. SG-1]
MPYYHLCCRYHGQVVRINDRFGRTHIGEITRVTRSKVFIRPVRPNQGYGYYGGGYGYYGFAYGIALGAITGLALAAFFW